MPRPFTRELTANQKAVLDWIRAFIRRHQMPPTVREIGRGLGYTSTRSVFDYLKVLERKGFLHRGELGARSLVVTDGDADACRSCGSVKVVGRVAAGKPIWVTEEDLGTVTVDRSMLGRGEVYALRVQGDSMVDAGILDGDWVMVRKQDSADHGDIVVAMSGEEATVKILCREGKRVWLKPANPAYQPLNVDPGQLRILGKVVGVHRKL